MKKKAVKFTEPRRVHIEGPIVGRMAGYKFYLPDEPPDWVKKEMEPLPIPPDEKDAEFWAKGGAQAILGRKAMGKLKKKFYSTPPSNSEISRMWKEALRNK